MALPPADREPSRFAAHGQAQQHRLFAVRPSGPTCCGRGPSAVRGEYRDVPGRWVPMERLRRPLPVFYMLYASFNRAVKLSRDGFEGQQTFLRFACGGVELAGGNRPTQDLQSRPSHLQRRRIGRRPLHDREGKSRYHKHGRAGSTLRSSPFGTWGFFRRNGGRG